MLRNIDPVTIKIAEVLLKRIENKDMEEVLITYGDLSKQLSSVGVKIDPRNLDTFLGELSNICSNEGMPLISVIVVSKDQWVPGDGFFKYFYPNTPRDQWMDLFMEQYNKLKAFEDWDCLYDCLGITL